MGRKGCIRIITFFAAKPVGSGTGVGLSIAERIVKHHGGEIKLSSIEGEGTTAAMVLPVAGKCGTGIA